MLFNSFQFIFFFIIVLLIYYSISHKYRWMLLLIASYYFYMCWKVEYVLLIFSSTIVDYFTAINIYKSNSKRRKKVLLHLSLFFNLGLLFFFKYFNLFNDSVYDLFNSVNVFYDKPVFNILLPVGISFYTFQTLSYTIDVYRGNTKPESHFGKFAVFISFFPQLVAGPIERSNRLIPNLKKKVIFSYENFTKGLKLMLWGFFLKLVVADRLGLYVDVVFSNLESHGSLTMIVASAFFLFQIYGDFAGYSFIAIGVAKTLGIELMENFRRPNFATSFSDLWKRWHISLSTWFRDYVYIPLGGNRVSKLKFYRNIFLTFLISGFWHGADWTFVLWGAYHGVFLVVEIFLKKHLEVFSKYDFTLIGVIFVFFVKIGSYFFFRANSVKDALYMYDSVFNNWKPGFYTGDLNVFILSIIAIFILNLIELKHEYFPNKFLLMNNKNYYVRMVSITLFIGVILYLGVFDGGQFIYFQF